METIKEMTEKLISEAQVTQLKNFYTFLYELIEQAPYSIEALISGLQIIKENNEKDLKDFEKSIDETPEITKPKK